MASSNAVWMDHGSNWVRNWLFPELKKIHSPKRRERAYEVAREVAIDKHPLLYNIESLLIVASLALLVPGFFLPSVEMVAGCTFGVTCVYVSFASLAIRRATRIQLRQIIHEDFWCHECDYLLRGNTSGRCPECGRPISADQQRLISDASKFGLEIDPGNGVE